MSRTYVSKRTKKLLNGLPDSAGDSFLLGRALFVTNSPHVIFSLFDETQTLDLARFPYELDAKATREVASSLINITIEQVNTMTTSGFIGTPEELQNYLQQVGKYLLRLKDGFEALG